MRGKGPHTHQAAWHKTHTLGLYTLFTLFWAEPPKRSEAIPSTARDLPAKDLRRERGGGREWSG